MLYIFLKLDSYLFCLQSCVSVNPKLPIYPSPLFLLWYSWVCFLCLWVGVMFFHWTFYLESLMDSCAVVRNSAGRLDTPLAQFPPLVLSGNTGNVWPRMLMLTQSRHTAFPPHKAPSWYPSIAKPTLLSQHGYTTVWLTNHSLHSSDIWLFLGLGYY